MLENWHVVAFYLPRRRSTSSAQRHLIANHAGLAQCVETCDGKTLQAMEAIRIAEILYDLRVPYITMEWFLTRTNTVANGCNV